MDLPIKKCVWCKNLCKKSKFLSVKKYLEQKFCSHNCHREYQKSLYREQKECPVCHKKFTSVKYAPTKYCSHKCYSNLRFGTQRKLKFREYLCLQCGKKCINKQPYYQAKFCNNTCAGFYYHKKLNRWSVKYDSCIICGRTDREYVCSGKCRTCYQKEYDRKRGVKPVEKVIRLGKIKKIIHLLDRLRRVKENKLKKKIRDSAKHHLRRMKIREVKTDINTKFLIELWKKTNICECCQLPMEEHCNYPYGRHLDHIIPICEGGHHLQNNVRYIHAYCNVRRNKKN